ncbi:MAG: hypothetical protein QM784_13190 [Polyangiaceae bacterium]
MVSSHGKRKLGKRLAWLFGCGSASAILLWTLVHSTSWAGPLVASTLRAVVGTDNVAKLEDFVYGIEDKVNVWRRSGEKPKAHWAVPAKTKPVALPPQKNEGVSWPVFEPKDVGPVHKSWSAPGDGTWIAVDDTRHPGSNTAVYKTLVHPDEHRSWAELFVVAIDLEQINLHAAAGTREPIAENYAAKTLPRSGKVPDEHMESLLAAFNGGFMAEHGHYGMYVNGTLLIKPRETSCTVVGYQDGTVEVATWKNVASAQDRMTWFRQTPACMYENDVMHLGLRHPETRLWGATLDGDTVIRRSAIGLDESRRILYVGISNHTTARALAEGMHHAGAVDIAQLDVNWSYPKFLIYGPGKERGVAASAFMEGFEYTSGDYVTKSSLRDFFYLTRRRAPRTIAKLHESEGSKAEPTPATSAKISAVTPAEGAAPTPKPLDGSGSPCPNCPK